MYKNLSDFGIKSRLKIVEYRGGKIPSHMTNSNKYAGKQLWYNKKLYTCIRSTTNTITFNVSGGDITISRKDALAPKGTIPKYKTKTIPEILEELRVNYPDAQLHVPKTGCQLHGDIDAELTINNIKYLIPWNY